jgi:hypothetical protein
MNPSAKGGKTQEAKSTAADSRGSGGVGEDEIDRLYRAPLAEFVERRDALAKELRSAGDRASASAVKAMKKPSRAAWALNMAVLEQPGLVDGLVTALAEPSAAGSTGVDLRSSISSIRAGVAELADRAAKIALDAGVELANGTLAMALLAVLGTTESFEQLRRGRLVDVPDAGGIDLLSALPELPSGRSVPPPKPNEPGPWAPRATAAPEPKEIAAARRDAEKAASELSAARARAREADRALADADAQVASAESRVRRAEDELQVASNRRDGRREDAKIAADALESAIAAAERAEKALERLKA